MRLRMRRGDFDSSSSRSDFFFFFESLLRFDFFRENVRLRFETGARRILSNGPASATCSWTSSDAGNASARVNTKVNILIMLASMAFSGQKILGHTCLDTVHDGIFKL
jgi:hypothetical protein